MRIIDARRLSCPQPLMLFHEAFTKDAASPMDVLLDNEVGVEHVNRAAKKHGLTVTAREAGDGGAVRLEIRR